MSPSKPYPMKKSDVIIEWNRQKQIRGFLTALVLLSFVLIALIVTLTH